MRQDQSPPTVRARYGAKMPWDYRGRDPLHRLQDSLIQALAKPIVPDRGLLFDQHSVAVREAKHERQEAFCREYPEVPLQALWREICTNKATIPAIADMPDPCVAAFVDVTAWCYAKEGTGVKGRFSLSRLWRAIDRDPADVESWVKPVGFQTQCGACGAPANALSRSSAVASSARPTRIECTRCKHVDVVGRSSAYDPDDNIAHRLSCPCALCEKVRADVCAWAESEIGRAIEELAGGIAAYALDGVADAFDEAGSSGIYDAGLPTRIEQSLLEGTDLKQALLAANRSHGSEEKRLASAIEDGVKAGFLKVMGVTAIGTGDALVAAARQGIDLGAYDDEHKLASIFGELASGSIVRVVRGCKLIQGLHTYLVPVVVDATWMVEEHTPAAAIGAAISRAHDRLSEAMPADNEPDERRPSWTGHNELGRAEELLRRAAGLVDQVLGDGSAQRCPELVLEILRTIQ